MKIKYILFGIFLITMIASFNNCIKATHERLNLDNKEFMDF